MCAVFGIKTIYCWVFKQIACWNSRNIDWFKYAPIFSTKQYNRMRRMLVLARLFVKLHTSWKSEMIINCYCSFALPLIVQNVITKLCRFATTTILLFAVKYYYFIYFIFTFFRSPFYANKCLLSDFMAWCAKCIFIWVWNQRYQPCADLQQIEQNESQQRDEKKRTSTRDQTTK